MDETWESHGIDDLSENRNPFYRNYSRNSFGSRTLYLFLNDNRFNERH